MSGSLGPLGWAWPRNIAGNAIGWGADGVTLANIPMESRNLYYFDAVGDGVTDDTDAVQAAFDWVAGGGLAGRALNITSGQYLLLDKVSVTVPNHTTVALHGSGGQAGTILVGNATGGIELLCSGSAPFVTVEKFAIVPAMAGAGFLLRVKGTYSGSGGGIGHNTVVVRDMEFSPLQRTTSTYYSLNPLDFEKMKRPYIERIVYRPGTQAPAYYGDYLVNLSDCYSPVIKDYVLGGYARIGIKAHHSVATEGFLSSHGRLTNCLRGIWYQSSPQPGVIIENTHINSSEGNIIIDGAQRFRVSGNLLYSNNSKVFSWTRSGNTLTVTCDPDSGGVSQTDHNIANGLNVRLGFNVADIENPEWDGDEDGTADGVPSGTFAATYINDGQFSVTDIGFGGLAASGTVDVRWAEAPFEDIWIKNGTLGLIHGNLYGHQASRLRRHVRLDATDTVAASPKLSGITCVDDMISARTSISPYYVGDICRNIVGRVPDVWAEELGIVAYPETLVEVDSAARDVAFQTSLDTFETRYVNGLVNAVPNGKFARGSVGWDEGSGWTVAQNTSEALSGKSALQYIAPNTSNNNHTFGDRITCREGDVIHLEWFYKVTTGTISLHRARATFYDASGVQVGSTLDGVTSTSAPSTYTRRTQEFAVPTTAVSCELLFRIGASTGATVYIDEISAVVLGPGAIFYNPEFATRAEFVTAVAAGLTLTAGRIVTADGLRYKRTTGATAISDLPGYEPCGDNTPMHYGAVRDGVTDDLAAFDAAKAFGRVSVPPGDYYLGAGPLELEDGDGFIGTVGFGAATGDSSEVMPRLLFDGAGTACITSADETTSLLYTRLDGLVIYHTGTHSHVINLKGPVGCTFENLNIETTNNGTGGIKTSRIESSPGVFVSSWVNNIHNCRVRVVSGGSYGGTARPIEFDFSDSAVTSSNFTGGIGSLYHGTGGLRMVACRFDHAYAASTYQLTVRTNYASVMPVCITACQIEEGLNGLLIDHDTNDATNTTRCMVSVVGNHFRCSDADAVGGGAEITLLNAAGSSVISGPVITGNTFASTVPEPFSYNAAHWDGLVIGPNTYAVAPSSGLFDFDVHGSHTVIDRYGMLLGDAAVKLAKGQTIRGVDNANMLAAINGTGPGVLLGVTSGNAPFVHGSRDADGTARRLLFGTDAADRLGLASDGTYFRPETDNTLDLGQTSNRFKTVHGVNFRVGPSSGAPTIEAGSGSPEGVVTANPASLYLDYTNGHGYTKTSGAGNTGWELNSPAVTQLLTAQSVGTGTTYTVDNTVITRRFKTLEFVARQLSHNDASNQTIRVELSGDNGSTWTAAQVVCASSPAATVLSGSVVIHNAAAASATRVIDAKTAAHGAITNALMSVHEVTVATGYVNAVRWSPAAGSFDGGTLSLIGRN